MNAFIASTCAISRSKYAAIAIKARKIRDAKVAAYVLVYFDCYKSPCITSRAFYLIKYLFVSNL